MLVLEDMINGKVRVRHYATGSACLQSDTCKQWKMVILPTDPLMFILILTKRNLHDYLSMLRGVAKRYSGAFPRVKNNRGINLQNLRR